MTTIRVIGGQWKRSPIDVLPVPGLRPTPDRVRETLFNWLGQDLTGWRCLDPFAGSGALGFEAASRGAAAVTLIEQRADLVRALEAVRQRLSATQVDIFRADSAVWLTSRPPQPQDLILLDPPFAADWLPRVLPWVMPWLARDGLLYIEAEAPVDAGLLARCGNLPLQIRRTGRAGQVHYHLLEHVAPGG